MAKATRLPATSERNKDKRRLHLREITDDPHAQLDSVGATLRAARLNRGVDPDQVAASLKMRREHVEAIEDNDFTRLPGRTYAIGFVRSYARYLGLDAEVMVQRFKEESAGREHDKTVDLVFPDAPEEKRAANGSLIVVAIVITAAIAGAYYVSIPQRHATTAAAPAEEPAIVVADTPTAAPSQPTSLLADGSQAQQVAPAEVPPGATAPVTLTPGVTQPVDAAPAPTSAAAATPTPPAATAPAGKVFGTENTAARIVFKATAPTYVLVKQQGPDGKVTIFDRTLNPGESYRAPDKPGVLLITGNAGGLDIEIDGKKIGTLGKSGEMLRNVPVDASYFVEHLASATPITSAPPSTKPSPVKPESVKPASVKPAAATPAPVAAAPVPAPAAPSTVTPATETPAPATPH